MPKEDPILDLLERQLTQASDERKQQTTAFERALSGLRWELRIIVLIIIILAAARDGFMGKVKIPGVEIDTRPAKTETPNQTSSFADGDAP